MEAILIVVLSCGAVALVVARLLLFGRHAPAVLVVRVNERNDDEQRVS